MDNSLADWTEWALIPGSVLLLAAIHRLDLLVIVVPIAVLAGYALCSRCSKGADAQRKM